MSGAHAPTMLPRRRIAIAAGGTAGHVYPALAIAEAYRAAVPDVEVIFLGTTRGSEAQLVPAHGYRLATIAAAPFFGVGPIARVRAATALVAGAAQARRLLRAPAVDLVLGLGNYAAAGAVLAAYSLGIPSIIHEANARAGLANLLLGRFADGVLLGFAAAATDFPRRPTRLTGTPVRPVFRRVPLARGAAWAPGAERAFRLLVVGGSQGSAFLNAHVPDLAGRVAQRGIRLEVEHQVGNADEAPIVAAYARARVSATVVPYIDDMPGAYGWADFAITCAGASTLAELALVALPGLVVPCSSVARDHQAYNARAFAEATGIWWSRETAWNADAFADRLAAFAGEPQARLIVAARLAAAATPEAAAAVVAACEQFVTLGTGASLAAA